MTITAAADGSALGNPGPAGWAWYVDEDTWHAGGWPHGTNNQGELMAVLDLFTSTAHRADEHLLILCDSQYVINCLTKWMPGWKRKGWKKADGKPVLNVELLKQLDAALKGRKFNFEWVKGHAGHPLNEAADERARAVATAYQQRRPIPSGPGFSAPGSGDAGSGGPGSGGAAGSPQSPAETAGSTSSKAQPDRPRGNTEQSRSGGFVPEPQMASEPDLFSLLDDEASAPENATPGEAVIELERSLLHPAVRSDTGELARLLHADFEEISVSGRRWSRDEALTALVAQESPGTELELISTSQLAENLVLLQYRSRTEQGTALRTSIWMSDRGQWRLRFHQGTPE